MAEIFNPIGLQDPKENNNPTPRVDAFDEHGYPLLDAERNTIYVLAQATTIVAQGPRDPRIDVRPPAHVNLLRHLMPN